MSTQLAPLGIQLRNYPEGVPLPSVSSRKDSRNQKAAKGKSKKAPTIQSLSLDDLNHLYSAIRNSDRPLHFALYQGKASGKLTNEYVGSGSS